MKNFVVDKEYFTFFMRSTKKENSLRDYTGIMKVKVLSKSPSKYYPYWHFKFEILESKPLGKTIAYNIHNYMNGGSGCASCDFFDSYDECVIAHDDEIKSLAKGLNTYYRDLMFKKLINKDRPKPSKLEVDSIMWYNSLPKKEQKFVQWIKEYYEQL
jgi:hypothetical protein